jgi:PAS domain S-box-containing protein
VTNTRDITGRMRAEEQIRFQRRLLDAVGQAVIATNLQGKIIYWNRAAEELYGWSTEEVMGHPIVEVTPSEELIERAEEIMSELRAGRSWSGEFVVQRKDGRTFPAMVTDTPVYDEQGTLVGIIGVSTDLTELKRTEELRLSEERFRLLAENAQDLIYRYRLKPTRGFEYVSPSATAIIGYTPEEHYADPELAYKIVYPGDRHLIDEVLRSPESLVTIRWLRKDGGVIWIEQRIKAVYGGAGEVVAIEGIARDVTERKWVEETLRETHEFLMGILDNAPLPIYGVSEEGRIRLANRFFADFVGMPQEKVIGSLLEDVFTADEARQFRENNRRVIETETPLIEEEWAEASDGRHYFETIKFPLRDPDMKTVAIGGISIDVTERRRAEEALSETRRAERRRIARDLHDIVLQDLSGALQSLRLTHLRSKSSALDLDLTEELEALGRATSGLRSAIYDLRHEKEQPFVESVESLVELNRQVTPERKIRLVVEEGFPVGLSGEESVELLRVLQEALANARRHSGARSVEVGLRTEHEEILIEVVDDGRVVRSKYRAGPARVRKSRSGFEGETVLQILDVYDAFPHGVDDGLVCLSCCYSRHASASHSMPQRKTTTRRSVNSIIGQRISSAGGDGV